jgi:hypothetical protein
MKKVLIISYYWPPSGKASHHFPVNIARHLPQQDIEPVILTVKEDKFSHKDESRLKFVEHFKTYRTDTFEPFDIYRKFIGKKEDEPLVPSETISKTNKSLSHKISIWIRMNLFVPDARVGWYFKAVKEGKKIFKENKIDAVITFGPPHSTHLIGLSLSKEFNVPFYTVFIDPWTDIIYYKGFKRNFAAVKLDNYLEEKVLNNSKASIFVTGMMRDEYVKKYPGLKDKSHLFYWGYNEEDFQSLKKEKNNEEEVLVHAGNIFDYQNPRGFWNTLRKEIDDGRNLKIKFIGTVSPLIKEEIKKNNLAERTEYLGFLTYGEMLQNIIDADYLLVGATEPRHIPGKLFEYLRTGNPIIAFGDDNEEVRNILKKANAGMMFRYNETGEEFFMNINSFKTDLSYVKQFDRKNIAKGVGEILEGVREP